MAVSFHFRGFTYKSGKKIKRLEKEKINHKKMPQRYEDMP